MGEQADVFDFAPEDGLHGPLQSRAGHLLAFLGGGPRPGGQELLVQAIRRRGRVGGTAAFQPQRQPAGAGADPSHETFTAFLHQAGLAQARLAHQKDDRARP